ncbi:MAG: hypothetical protein JWQ86_975 [Mycobacterium sp.]|nr:hypothetical protein [Mycobacterium sp.]
MLVGAASLPYVNAPNFVCSPAEIRRTSTGSVPTPKDWSPSSCRDSPLVKAVLRHTDTVQAVDPVARSSDADLVNPA